MAGKGKKSRPPVAEVVTSSGQVIRLCLFCKKQPAKFLDVLHSPGKEPSLFCCLTCAASWSINELAKTPVFLQEYSVSSAVLEDVDQVDPKEVPNVN